MNYQILPKQKPYVETHLTMETTKGDKSNSETMIFTGSKSRTIDKLKSIFPYDNKFWLSLNKNMKASLTVDNGVIVTFSLEVK